MAFVGEPRVNEKDPFLDEDDPNDKGPRLTSRLTSCPVVCLWPPCDASSTRDVCGCTCKCTPQPSCKVDSLVLLLNAVAATVHLLAFVVLLTLVVALDVDLFTKPLEESITVWQTLNATTYPTCKTWDKAAGGNVTGNASAAFPKGASCFETAEGLFAIYKSSKPNGELTLGYLILSFSFLSFLFQGARPCLGLQTEDGKKLSYLDEVDRRVNVVRWVEYAFSATTMILALSFLVSPHLSYSGAVLISTSTAATQLCGMVGELMLEVAPLSQGGDVRPELVVPAWIAHVAGWVLQFGVFAAIFSSYFLSAAYGDTHKNAGSPPAFVSAIVVGIALFFASFGLVQFVDFVDRTCGKRRCPCKRKDENQQQVDCTGRGFELAYITLSLSSKLFLSLIVATQLWFRPDDDA